jgi:hypothetical protein
MRVFLIIIALFVLPFAGYYIWRGIQAAGGGRPASTPEGEPAPDADGLPPAPIRTLALIGVEDPSAYGLVRLNEDRSVKEFLEKPSPDQIDTNLISAGAYVLEREVLSLIPPDTTFSIERAIASLSGRPASSSSLYRAMRNMQ